MDTRAKKTELVDAAATTSVSSTQAAIAVVTSDLSRLCRDKLEELENRLEELAARNHKLESKMQSFLKESNKISAQQQPLWEKAIQKAEVHADNIEQHNRRSNIRIRSSNSYWKRLCRDCCQVYQFVAQDHRRQHHHSSRH